MTEPEATQLKLAIRDRLTDTQLAIEVPTDAYLIEVERQRKVAMAVIEREVLLFRALAKQ